MLVYLKIPFSFSLLKENIAMSNKHSNIFIWISPGKKVSPALCLIKTNEYSSEGLSNSNQLTLPAPCISESCVKIINLIFIFTLPCGASKFFWKSLRIYKIFWGTTKKCENNNVSQFSLFVRNRDGKG